ncbi:hypothetical protein FJ444_20670 [Aestuariibacter sp. GS-14]|uniref:acyltransferase family protein n=1 Tax=Aestuariibacter sp. GS-14 TaxID=2590670 RepID=UPI00112E807E|nr:acyltransferase family protein [Aestuariibacter sp. GS-14]TPV53688.1 hypothetical protein FJ444_20670 [Aestuariibacter sp. GS-14]
MHTGTSTRLHYLDATRALALLLGIVFHASLSFMPVFIGWAVMDVSTSNLVSAFALVSHTFRMALFFLIAGYFSRMTLNKTSMPSFLQSRAVRLGVPFVAGWFLLRPLLVSGWIAGAQSLRGDVDAVTAIYEGIATLGSLPNGLLVGTHLWFLYYLMLFTVCALALRMCLVRIPVVHGIVVKLSSKLVSSMSVSHWSPVLMALPTVLCLWWMNNWGIDTPDKSLVPHLPTFCLYFGSYLMGWSFQRDSLGLQSYSKLSLSHAVFALVSITALILLAPYESQPGHPDFLGYKAAYAFAYAVTMWSMIPLTLGVCKALFNTPKAWISYLANASYWLYLIHLPLVIALQIAVSELPLHWSVKLTMVCSGTLFTGLLLYEILVKKSWLGRILNGQEKQRVGLIKT